MLRNALTLIAGGFLLILGFMFSVVLLAIVAVLGLLAWGYLWWKTRKIRQTMAASPPEEGQIFDGEAIIVEETREGAKIILPDDPPPR